MASAGQLGGLFAAGFVDVTQRQVGAAARAQECGFAADAAADAGDDDGRPVESLCHRFLAVRCVAVRDYPRGLEVQPTVGPKEKANNMLVRLNIASTLFSTVHRSRSSRRSTR